MAYVYDFIVLLVWTGICAAFIYGVERILEAVGYRPAMHDESTPPLPPSE